MYAGFLVHHNQLIATLHTQALSVACLEKNNAAFFFEEMNSAASVALEGC